MSFRDLLESDVETGYEEYDDFEGELEDHPAYKDLEISLEEYSILSRKLEMVEEINDRIKTNGVSQNLVIALEELHPFLSDRVPLYTYTKEGSNINQIYVEEGIGDFVNSVITFMMKHIGKIILAIIAIIGFILKGRGEGSSSGGGGGSIVESAVKAKPVILDEYVPFKIVALTEEQKSKLISRLVSETMKDNEKMISDALKKHFSPVLILHHYDRELSDHHLKRSYLFDVIEQDVKRIINSIYGAVGFKITPYEEALKDIGVNLKKDKEDIDWDVVRTLDDNTKKVIIKTLTESFTDDIMSVHSSINSIRAKFSHLASGEHIVSQGAKLASVKDEYVAYLRKLNQVIFDFERFKLNDLEKIAAEGMKRKLGDVFKIHIDNDAFTEEVLRSREINDVVLGNATTAVPVNNTLKICGNTLTINANSTAKEIFKGMIGIGGGNPNAEKMVKISDIQDKFKPSIAGVHGTFKNGNDIHSFYITSNATEQTFSPEDSGLFSNSTMTSLRKLHHSIEEIEKDLADFNKNFDTNFNTYFRDGFMANSTKDEQREQAKKEYRHHVNSTMRIIFSGYINLVVMYKLCYEEINKLAKLNKELFDFHKKIREKS